MLRRLEEKESQGIKEIARNRVLEKPFKGTETGTL
jgi:hypothetical protein